MSFLLVIVQVQMLCDLRCEGATGIPRHPREPVAPFGSQHGLPTSEESKKILQKIDSASSSETRPKQKPSRNLWLSGAFIVRFVCRNSVGYVYSLCGRQSTRRTIGARFMRSLRRVANLKFARTHYYFLNIKVSQTHPAKH